MLINLNVFHLISNTPWYPQVPYFTFWLKGRQLHKLYSDNTYQTHQFEENIGPHTLIRHKNCQIPNLNSLWLLEDGQNRAASFLHWCLQFVRGLNSSNTANIVQNAFRHFLLLTTHPEHLYWAIGKLEWVAQLEIIIKYNFYLLPTWVIRCSSLLSIV